jgi:hypothetical protein
MLKRVGIALGLVLICAVSILRVARPPDPIPATAPDTVFSAQRAMRDLGEIAKRPHPMGTADHDRVRDYIVARLTALGLKPEIQQTTALGTRYQEAGRVQNILARLPGNVAGGKAVLVVAHYDGVEAGPAAADDGAGTAAILETLRGLRASNRPLRNDVIALFTDGEESGLLGAAAFVREHPWAKDVGVVLNFEARGTSGRSVMFETGAGNLDAARALRNAPDATAGSVFATIYRLLPNDTDLSEFAVLGLPALNFAFADGVERYHTSHDDIAHLNPGSLQHHGSQMLEMTRLFGRESLPRPRTGDGVFFDLPVVGLVVYPQGFELPLAIVALILAFVTIVRERKGVVVGVVTTVIAIVLAGLIGWVVGRMLTGPRVWSGWYAAAVALLAVTVTSVCVAVARRWATSRAIHVGALLVWALVALALAVRVPGVAYLFTWPVLFAAAALLLARGRAIGEWIAAIVTLLILPGFIYGVSVVMLGLAGAGAIALAVMVSLIALLLTPLLELVVRDTHWFGVGVLAAASVMCAMIAALTVHPSGDHPLRTALVYAENADSGDAWLGTMDRVRDDWTRAAVGTQRQQAPAWTGRLTESLARFVGRKVGRVPLVYPLTTVLGDSVINGVRRVTLRANAPAGTIGLIMRVTGAKVLESSIDGRVVDTARYRYRPHDWVMQYWAVPDSGAIVGISVPAGVHFEFELAARRPGIPAVPELMISPRPEYVVPSQTGDVNIVYRAWRF